MNYGLSKSAEITWAELAVLKDTLDLFALNPFKLQYSLLVSL